MSEEDIRDPRVVPRWLEAGISGVARSREWDAVTVVELPELEDSALGELSFVAFESGEVEGGGASPEVLTRLVGALAGEVQPPFEARAVRRSRLEWSVGARELPLELIDLPDLEGVGEIALALAPDGSRTIFVDGEEADADSALGGAVAELEGHGRARARSAAFVATARRTGSRWELVVNPL